MTTTDTPTTDTPTTDVEAEPELCWLNIADLVPNPDNPRQSLGDLTELVRSIRALGVLEPLVVLPADEDGKYTIVAGHRRHAGAAQVPGCEVVPAVVRPMSRLEALEAMVSENVNRSDLNVAEEVAAIENMLSIDGGLTPHRLCRRLGRSQAWVRSRMAVIVLPTAWRDALATGDLTLVAAEAAASAADLGPEHVEVLCERLARRPGFDVAREVERYRDELRLDSEYEAAVAEATEGPHPVFTADDPPPDRAKALGELFDTEGTQAHSSEPCHAVVIQRPTWYGTKVRVQAVCTDPRRHTPKRVAAGKGSDLASERTTRSQGGDDSHAKRKGRLSRLAHATEVFARGRGGVSQRDLAAAAQRALIGQASREVLAHAATILGYADPRKVTTSDLLDSIDSPADLARVAGAIAYGDAEAHMYWSVAACTDYLAMLTGTGWTPDEWTAAALAERPHDSGAEVEVEVDEPDEADEETDEADTTG